MSETRHETVVIGPDAPLSTAELARVVHGGARLSLSHAAHAAVARAHRFVEQLIRDRRIVYGITTGFGPLAGTYVDPTRSEELQRNLIHHLRAGVGPLMPTGHVLAMMVARAASLSQGRSGIRPDSLGLLIAMTNERIIPEVPSMGTVGASGDLTPLAHMAAGLLGEGSVQWLGGRRPTREALEACGLAPLVPGPKEAIALVNGTSTMSGIAALNGAEAHAALEYATRNALLYAEVMAGRSEAFDTRIGMVRPHRGQRRVHEIFERETAGGSRLVQSSSTTRELPRSEGQADDALGVYAGNEIIQDPYSVRCIPQLYGAAFDALRHHNDTVDTELQAVTDNPILIPEDDAVLQGGNFFGQHVGLASDALTNALVVVAGHVERSIDRITDPVRSRGLPPMLQARDPGLQSGFMGAQVTATALRAEMRTRASPASIQSISTNAANQDVVTMGTIAARTTAWQMERLWELLAIQSLVLVQATELRATTESQSSLESAGFSRSSRVLVDFVRTHVPPLTNDRPLSEDIQRFSAELRHYALDRFPITSSAGSGLAK